jgi:hypothetical protein
VTALIRSALLLFALIVILILGVAHGLRGLVVAGAIILAWAAKETRVWKSGEAFLVRVTGSRRRAGVTVLGVIIAAMVAFNVYQATH